MFPTVNSHEQQLVVHLSMPGFKILQQDNSRSPDLPRVEVFPSNIRAPCNVLCGSVVSHGYMMPRFRVSVVDANHDLFSNPRASA